ncbi:sensor histidine kinase [Caloramator sp. E03]|uniref:sensor histidine kinase n=1 Tax=Caloramator sp. E03 TaxID=2576307 RepID=UPI001110B900|nr:sensor histidine kinase [Caloramator sp. E03]QCX33164.1 sensor histidine kinase [Caloramator sp. E03]
MKYIFKSTFFLYLIIKFSMSTNVSYRIVALTLIFICINIIKEKYYDSVYIVIVEIILIFFAVKMDWHFIILNGIILYDFFYKKAYIGIIPPIIFGVYFLKNEWILEYIMFLSLCAYLAYINKSLEEKNNDLKYAYDKERRYRYELESAKEKLIKSSIEAVHIAKIKERNRIARQIHDNVGHSISGVLFQLQACSKLFDKDRDKALILLEKSIDELSKALNLLRDTVHNIKPKEDYGIEYIKDIIDKYKYCDVEFKVYGDFNSLSASHIEILYANIKEALTNASKYSNATKIEISIDINEKYVRLYIKDNGTGCKEIHEGLGISGMRERIRNIGGSISVSGEEGFMIVCILPMKLEGDINETFDS